MGIKVTTRSTLRYIIRQIKLLRFLYHLIRLIYYSLLILGTLACLKRLIGEKSSIYLDIYNLYF
jgi:hypothetical protein